MVATQIQTSVKGSTAENNYETINDNVWLYVFVVTEQSPA